MWNRQGRERGRDWGRERGGSGYGGKQLHLIISRFPEFRQKMVLDVIKQLGVNLPFSVSKLERFYSEKHFYSSLSFEGTLRSLLMLTKQPVP